MVLASNGWVDVIFAQWLMTDGMAILLGMAACFVACFRKAAPAAILLGTVAVGFAVAGVRGWMDMNRSTFTEYVADCCCEPMQLVLALSPFAFGLTGAVLGAVRLLSRHGAKE